MPPKSGTKDQGSIFRIIPLGTVTACTRILKLANDSVMQNYRGPLDTLPEYSRAFHPSRLDDTNVIEWPLVVKVWSSIDLEFQSTLRHTIDWCSRMSKAGINLFEMEAFITPFPTFTSRHLQTDRHGRVINRNILTLHECEASHVGVVDNYHQNLRALAAFKAQLLAVRWICEDPERRLYREKLNEDQDRDDAVSVKTDVESHADSQDLLTPVTSRASSPGF
ncbi:hypothetical protein DDE82_007307 [Stemphylium lycopersici]|nr:hypothetical protein DDE82_007307 [Stemphylium lycopersici]